MCHEPWLQAVHLRARGYGLHSLGHEAGPVVAQDIVDPAGQSLVAVAGHVLALLGVLKGKQKTQCSVEDKCVSVNSGVKCVGTALFNFIRFF